MGKHVLLVVISLVFIVLVSCSGDKKLTKEQLLLQSVEQLELRFEARKLGDIIEYISEEYEDENGRKLTDIKRAIQLQLMRHKSLYVFSTITNIDWIDENNATMQITAAMAGRPIESVSVLTSMRADMIKFTVKFILEGDIFKIKSAQWNWASPSDFL